MARKLLALAGILAAAGLTTAALPAFPALSFATFLALPEIVSHELVVEEARGEEVEGRLIVQVRNPNVFAIRIEHAELDVIIDGDRLLTAESNGPLVLEPRAVTPLEFEGEVEAEDLRRVSEGEGPVPVRVKGVLRVGWGLGSIDVPVNVEHTMDRGTVDQFLEACKAQGECAAAWNVT